MIGWESLASGGCLSIFLDFKNLTSQHTVSRPCRRDLSLGPFLGGPGASGAPREDLLEIEPM